MAEGFRLVFAVAAVLVLSGGCSSESVVSWDEVDAVVGESAQVCGPLASVATSDGATFLNLGLDYPDPDRLTIVIRDTSPDWTWDEGQEVCGEGKVSRYEGAPQMQFDNYDDFYYSTSSDASVDAEFQ